MRRRLQRSPRVGEEAGVCSGLPPRGRHGFPGMAGHLPVCRAAEAVLQHTPLVGTCQRETESMGLSHEIMKIILLSLGKGKELSVFF